MPFTLDTSDDDSVARMRELDALIRSGRGDMVRVPAELAPETVGAQEGNELYALPNELRRLDYLRNAGRHNALRRELTLFKQRWLTRSRTRRAPKLLKTT